MIRRYRAPSGMMRAVAGPEIRLPSADHAPLFSCEPSPFERRDDEAVDSWPYPLPQLQVSGQSARYLVGLDPGEGPTRGGAAWLSIMLCPAGVSPDTHGVEAMDRAGVVTVHYNRRLDGSAPSRTAPAIKRGWHGPEYVYGGSLGKTRRTFVAVAEAQDGYALEVTLNDDPRQRTRSEALDLLDRAVKPFRRA